MTQENNNNVSQELSGCGYESSEHFQNIFQLFLRSKCQACSRQIKVSKLAVNKTDVKTAAVAVERSTEISETTKEVIKHAAVIVIITSVVYANSLDGDFVHDDISAIVTNNDALGKSSIFSVFTNDFWGMNIRDKRSHKSYRPLTVLTFR